MVAVLEEAAGEDVDVIFTDYSRRDYPLLDMARPVGEYQYAHHVGNSLVTLCPAIRISDQTAIDDKRTAQPVWREHTSAYLFAKTRMSGE